MRSLLMLAVAMALAGATAAHAETEQDETVSVRLQDVRDDMAAELDVLDVLLPETIDVPASVAAEVCGNDAAAFTADADTGRASCAAVRRSEDLTRFVQEQMAVGGGAGDAATDGDDVPSPLQREDETTGSILDASDEPAGTSGTPGSAGDDAQEVAPSDLRDEAEEDLDLGPEDEMPRPAAPGAPTAPGTNGASGGAGATGGTTGPD